MASDHIFIYTSFIAGSAGDPDAPQFIIGNRAVTLEYAKDEKKERDTRNDRGSRSDRSEREERGGRGDNDRDYYGGGGGGGGGRREETRSDPRDRDVKLKNDWLCDKVRILYNSRTSPSL